MNAAKTNEEMANAENFQRSIAAPVGLSVELQFPGPGGALSTTVGLPVGRTAVLGNVTGSTTSSALILTVRPDLVAH